MRRFARTSPVLALTAAALLVTGCTRNPVTGGMELSLVSEGQEIAMGREGAQQIERSIGVVQDEGLQTYVEAVGMKMARGSERPELPWRFRVLDDPMPNAFALPGGFIYLTRGMMALMDTESELASVLGHEIGHVTAKHSVSQISKAQLAQLGLGLGSVFVPEIAAASDIAGAGLGLLFLKFGRDDERQADDLGFRYALEQGYDVRDMADVFSSLQRLGEARGGSGVPGWLSTHPDPGDRVEAVGERIAALDRSFAGTVTNRAAYLDKIDGMVYGENPRNGFFRNSVFLHPDLEFQIHYPAGWKTQNLPRAVVAISEREDAIIQLTLAEQDSPDAAARAFLDQQGVRQGRVVNVSINGLSAVSAGFQATTSQGELAGTAAFIRHDANVYQVVGYSAASRYNAYAEVFDGVLGSFAPLRDREVLAVQPKRIRIVRTDRQMTLVGFDRRHPSSIDMTALALINQLPAPTDVVPAGTLLKRVTES